PLSHRFNLPLQIADEFTEIGFGDWTDQAFDDLSRDAGWSRFNTFRSSNVPPGAGELMLEVQARVVRKLNALMTHHQFVVVVTHGDVIRAAFAHYLGVHLDLFQRVEVDPASLSLLELGDEWLRVRLLNCPSAGSPLQLPNIRHQ
nr:histidine phosphatase family protein [Chthoniobacterales bacterium]